MRHDPDEWEPVSRRAAWCPDCRTWSPSMPDPDSFIDWTASHETECAESAERKAA